ncbi:MAG TPA: hypothetical protein DDY58_03560 [Terrisporobacter glycolicus]|uniref:leucine-rich repeat domain-containing protein n=1 Tax=Terrisporobacter TaxID=1505652 RepID=UPI000E819A7A|nr:MULTISPECIES: leucine-rich repeat domain-containing protein [Terrisporobacter]HBI91577.1 hypothetical protein [Terrisporobacter hibernicus]
MNGNMEESIFYYKLLPNKSAYSISLNTTLDIPNNIEIPKEYNGLPVTHIESKGFANCENLISVFIPNTIKSINSYGAFKGCTRKLDSYAFYRCENLINIINKENKDNIQILGESCFMYCDSIKKVYFEKVKKIEKNCFLDCRSLEEIHLDSVKFIGETAIYRSSTIKKINLGKELKYIDRYGISPRENSQIFINAIIPPVYEEGLFCYFDYNVPSESVELYKKAPTWSVCSNRIYPLTKNLIE